MLSPPFTVTDWLPWQQADSFVCFVETTRIKRVSKLLEENRRLIKEVASKIQVIFKMLSWMFPLLNFFPLSTCTNCSSTTDIKFECVQFDDVCHAVCNLRSVTGKVSQQVCHSAAPFLTAKKKTRYPLNSIKHVKMELSIPPQNLEK